MTIYVDDLQEYPDKPFGHRQWCHMWTDGDIEDLHEMARNLGLQYAWFQTQAATALDHYDLVPSKRREALKMGAQKGSLLPHMRKVHSLDDSLLGRHLARNKAAL